MKLGPGDLEHLAACACTAARAAGALIARSRPAAVAHKPGQSLASQVVTEVDRAAETALLEVLTPTVEAFELAVLSEERADDGERLVRDYHWCIDPLDGTLPFIEGAPGYAVSIALVSRAGQPVIGVVFDPVRGVLCQAIAGSGVSRDGAPWSAPAPAGVLTVFLDRSLRAAPVYPRLYRALSELARARGHAGVAVDVGAGAVISACGVLERPPACYLKLPRPEKGGGHAWDFAATACLLTEAGAVAADADGTPLELNRAGSTFMNHRGVIFASDPALGARLRPLVAAIAGPGSSAS